ncbi:unnamed protein product [Moneuplotes crassus]|uniref:Uncharacterized protein n=1 Tax=Euplotes crassus TaxID=5936 RepID=A0AAD1Y9G9_EUPCR|nr:unnamed protein product [Moneuplotes crassus]
MSEKSPNKIEEEKNSTIEMKQRVSKKVNRKISPSKRAPKRIRKELTKVISPPLQVCKAIETIKTEPSQSKTPLKHKSLSKKTLKKTERKRPAKSGVLNKPKRQKIKEEKEVLRTKKTNEEVKEKPTKLKRAKKEEDKESQLKAKNVGLRKMTKASPKRSKMDAKRKRKEINVKSKLDSRLVQPHEIKKAIESSCMAQDKILDLIDVPQEEYYKIFDQMRDISMTMVRKIEAHIRKSRSQRRRLKEMFLKTLKNQENHSKVMSNKPSKGGKTEDGNKIRMKLSHIKKEISGGEMHICDPAHMLDEMVYIPNKSSRNDVIEYNPVELSLEDSDASEEYDEYPSSCKDLTVRGRAMPIYGCKNCGKNPYYTILSKPHKHSRHRGAAYESIEGQQFNCLGIDEQEVHKFHHQIHEDNILSHYDGGNPQDRSNMLDEEYSDTFMGAQELGLPNNLGIDKEMDENSEEIIAINDTENEILVPEAMQVQGIGEGEECDEMY